jgi:solute carrier family 25 (mitochondrial S-adenosylmethionine transporter), member 26
MTQTGAKGAGAGAGGPPRYSGVVDVLRTIVREEGFPALFRGVVPRVMWISVGGSIFFGTYETAVKLLTGQSASKSH